MGEKVERGAERAKNASSKLLAFRRASHEAERYSGRDRTREPGWDPVLGPAEPPCVCGLCGGLGADWDFAGPESGDLGDFVGFPGSRPGLGLAQGAQGADELQDGSSGPVSDSGDSETAALCQLGQRAERVEPRGFDQRALLVAGEHRTLEWRNNKNN